MEKYHTIAYLRVSTTDQDVEKSKLDAFRPQIEALLADGSTQKFIAARYHTTEANLSRWMKKHNLSRIHL